MIRLDLSTGSGELLPLFTPYGVTVERCKLQFGDMDWIGKGPRGKCAVVVERKRIDDLIQSMRSKRLSGHQLPGMARDYDYGYLVVEGIWRAGENGEVEVLGGNGNSRWYGRGIHYRAVSNYLMGLALRAGMLVWRTAGKEETVRFVVDQYRMWTDKAWHQHQAHDQVYAPAEETAGSAGVGMGVMISLRVRDVGLAEKMLMQVPGLDRKARWAAEHFEGRIRRAVCASEEEWEKVRWRDRDGKWKKMGKGTAKGIVERLSGGGEGEG